MSSQDYAEMIEIPVSSCEMVTEPVTEKKRSKKRLIKKVNGRFPFFTKKRTKKGVAEEADLNAVKANMEEDFNTLNQSYETSEKKAKGGKIKFNLVTAQVITVFVLAIGILLTNIFWKDSGINNLLKSVFATETTVTADERGYEVFQAFAPSKNDVQVTNGIMKVNSGAVYSPADGKVVSVKLGNGKYTITISHSDNYKTVITGADYTYAKEGDKVFTSTPVCYSKEGGVEVAMYDKDSLISGYTLDGGKVVWQN